MKPVIFSLTAILAMAFISCKKTETPPNEDPQTTVTDYTKLKTGNYWVYQIFEIDGAGNATPLDIYDSAYVVSDTVIRGNTYHKIFNDYENLPGTYSFLRDSAKYIVNENGTKIFALEDTSVLRQLYILNAQDTVYRSVTKIANKNFISITPSGTYTAIQMQTVFYIWPKYSAGKNIMQKNTAYAKGIGVVTETLPIYLRSKNVYERRLVRYKVN